MIVLGADTHKRSHTVAAIATGTGELLGERTVPVGRGGFGALLRWARSLDAERSWALEDCRHVSGSLERFLIGRGERVVRIPTHLTAKARKSARQRGKSDPIDAVNVARAALQEGLSSFPVAHLDGPELDLRLLVDHRERLVRHRVELNNTLQWHLHDLWPELQLPGGALFSKARAPAKRSAASSATSPAASGTYSSRPARSRTCPTHPSLDIEATHARARRRPGQSPLGQRSSTRAANDNRR
jgi:transposase